MNDFIENQSNINYKQRYELYRNLPIIIAAICSGIFAIATLVLFFVLATVNVGYAFLALLVGAGITVAVYFVNMFFLSLFISPMIVQTDTLLEINKKISAASGTAVPSPAAPKVTVKKWKCSSCGALNNMDDVMCSRCFHKRSTDNTPPPPIKTTSPNVWSCPHCGVANRIQNKVCQFCLKDKPN